MAEAAGTLGGAEELERKKPRNFYLDTLIRLFREKPLGAFGLILVVIYIVTAVVGPTIAPYDPNALSSGPRLEAPSFSYPFGTDNLGRDVFSRVLVGSQTAITIGFGSVAIATVISAIVGVVSGYFGGWFDMIAQRFVDAFIAFPAIVFLVAAGTIFENLNAPGLPEQGLLQTKNVALIGLLGLLFGIGQSRIVRSSVLSVKELTFVEAARASGAADGRMITKHVFPNVTAPIITLGTLNVGNAILITATLSFLGLGVPPDVPDWGAMLNREARSFMTQAWWIAVFPGVALSMAVFSFNMLGDALRDLLDPRLRGSV